MVEFALDVTIDPSSAAAGAVKVIEGLEAAEDEAAQLKRALKDALSTRDAGTAQALRGIQTVLERTEERAIITDARISQLGRDVTGRGVREFGNAVTDVERKASSLDRTIKRLFAGVTFAVVTRELAQMADVSTNLSNRLRLVTEDQGDLLAVQQQLLDVAAETRTSFEGTSQIFTRLAVSAKELGTTNQDLVRFTELVNKTVVLSGASAQEANAALIQLSQGLSSGALRGDELRSVLEQLPAVADVIARKMSVTRGELRELGQQGEITSRVILDAFAEAAEDIDRRFATTVPTIGQAFSVLRTRAIESVASLDRASDGAGAFSRAVLFAADNVDVLRDATIGLGVAVGVTLATKQIPKAIAAYNALTVAQQAAKVSTLVTTAGIGVLVAATSAAVVGSREQRRAIEEAGEAAEKTLTPFGSLGNQILNAQKELKQLRATFDAGGQSNQVAADRIRQVEAALAALTGTSQKARDEALKAAEVRDRGSEAFREQLAELQEEARLLALTSDERKIQEELTRRIADAKGKDKDLALDAALRAELEALVRSNAARARENELLDRFEAPAQKYKRTLTELEDLHRKGRLSLDGLTSARRQLTAEFEKKQEKVEDPFEAALKTLKRQNEELEIRLKHEGAEEKALLVELDLREKGRELTADQRAQLAGVVIEQEELTEGLEKQKKDEQELERLRRRQTLTPARTEQILDEVDAVGKLRREEEQLLALRQGTDPRAQELAPELDRAIEDLRLRQLEASEELGAGFERAFIKIKQEARDLAAVGEQVVNVFADRATDALVKFAQTGELSFKELASSILDDLTRILARLLVVQAISFAVGGSAVAPNPGINPGAQHGAVVQPGQRPRPVGENGPELFVPRVTGTIVPNPRDAPQQPPPVNVQVVNVASEQDVPRAIATGIADEQIVNAVERNLDRIRARLG